MNANHQLQLNDLITQLQALANDIGGELRNQAKLDDLEAVRDCLEYGHSLLLDKFQDLGYDREELNTDAGTAKAIAEAYAKEHFPTSLRAKLTRNVDFLRALDTINALIDRGLGPIEYFDEPPEVDDTPRRYCGRCGDELHPDDSGYFCSDACELPSRY